MTEAVYFVVEQRAGREYATLHYEHLQPAGRPIYTLRLDRLPDGEAWVRRPLAELYGVYCRLRDEGKLPPSNLADPPRAAEKKGRILGDWWTPPPFTWEDRPPDRWGAAGFVFVDGDLVREADAPPSPGDDDRRALLSIGKKR